jgi:tetratricopeptide (TPR) repeat protein
MGVASLRRRMHLAVLLAAALATTGCTPGPLSRQGHETFLAGHGRFQAGDYRDAESQFTRVIRTNPSSWALSEVYYFRGLSRLRQGKTVEAKADFRQGATRYGRELTQVYSAVALANLEYEAGNDAVAAHLYSQAADHPVRGLPMDAVLYRLSVSLQRLGRWDEADRRLAQLINDHSDSPMAAAARRRFQATFFTVQVGAYGEKRNARAMADKLRGAGWPVSTSIVARGGKTLHTVCVGRYRTHGEASAAASRLKVQGYSALVKP